jgi:hypothetical protein
MCLFVARPATPPVPNGDWISFVEADFNNPKNRERRCMAPGEGGGVRTGRDHMLVWLLAIAPVAIVLLLAAIGAVRRMLP